MTDDYVDRLESWATMAAQELQDICDDAQEAAGDPDGEGELPGVRQLLRELDEIMPANWQQELQDLPDGCDRPLSALEELATGDHRK